MKLLAFCVLAACSGNAPAAAEPSQPAPIANQTTTPDPSPQPTVTIGRASGPCTRSSNAQPLPPDEQRRVEAWVARGLVTLDGFVTSLCACTDDACVQQVGGDQRRWSLGWLKPLTPTQRYEAWMLYCTQSSALMERYYQCAEPRHP